MKGKYLFFSLIVSFGIAIAFCILLTGISIGDKGGSTRQKLIDDERIEALTKKNMMLFQQIERFQQKVDEMLGLKPTEDMPRARPSGQD